MSDIFLTLVGGALGLVIIAAAFYWALLSEPRAGRSWLAPPSGRRHDDIVPPGAS